MPGAIPAIAGALVSKAVGGGIIGAILGAVVTAGVGALLHRREEPELPDFSFQDQARGINANIANPVAPIPVVYGSYRFAGSRVYTGVTGANNKYLHMVISFAEGEIEEFTDVFLDDVSVTDGRFSGLVSFGDGQNAHLGSDTQTADTAAVSAITDWSTSHRLRGVSYLYMRLTYDPEVFSRIPVVSATVKGKKVVDVVAGGSPAWSDNPANCIYDYLTNTRYGRGIPASEIDIASFQTAHGICAALISNSPEPSQATYTCDGLINIDRPTLDNLRDLLTSCRGYLIFTGGQYRLIVDQAEASVFAFTESNIVGQMNISLDSKSARFNRVRARYYNADKNHQPDLVISDSSTYRTADNGTLLERSIELQFTTDVYRARRIAYLELKQSRYTISVEFNTTLEGLRAEVGDVVTITHSTPGWISKKFRIIEIGINSEDTVKIQAREYSDVYTPSAPPAKVAPPVITLPPVNDIADELAREPEVSWLYSFESESVEDWTDDDGSIAITSDTCVGDFAGLVTHGGGGETASASIVIPKTFAANVLATVDNQIRMQFWAKQPSADAASGLKVRLVGSSENSGWQDFTTSTSCQAFGFVWKPTTAQTSLTLEVIGDNSDTGTDGTIIDNILLYKLPDYINASNIGTWIGTLAVGEAYIANAAIDTLKIKGDAVTVPSSAYTSGNFTVPNDTTWRTAQTLAVTTTGAPVIIQGFAGVNVNSGTNSVGCLVEARIVRDSTTLTTVGCTSFGYANQGTLNGGTVGNVYRDTPSAGSHTYYLQTRRPLVFGLSVTINVFSRSLTVTEMKK